MIAEEMVDRLSGKFDDVEVYVEQTKTKEFGLKNSKDYSKGLSIDKGCGIRLIKNGKSAFAYKSFKDDVNVDNVVEDVLAAIDFSENLDANILSRDKGRSKRKKDINVNKQEIMEMVHLMDNAAKKFDRRVVDVKGAGVSISVKQIEVANSLGVCASDVKTYVGASVSVLAQDKIADIGWYSLDADNIKSLDFKYIAKNAASKAVNKLYPKKISTKKYSVIFENSVFTQILSHFFPAFDAYSVINHTTALEHRLGESIFGSSITIMDSKEVHGRPNNMLIDDEGTKREDVIVVENGVLKNFLNNVYTSDRLKFKNTGNAKRASWMNVPRVGAFNFHIEPDKDINRNQLLNKIDGVYITEVMGLHMANNISGDFSFGINGFFIHNGELVSYFKSATFADNFFDMMLRVVDVSDDMYFSSSFGSPDVAIADCLIGGSG